MDGLHNANEFIQEMLVTGVILTENMAILNMTINAKLVCSLNSININ